MDKLVVFFAMINLTALEIGSLFFSNSPLMWLAGSSTGFILARAFVILLLIALIVTHPPRNNYLRAFVGSVAVIIFSSVLYMTFGRDGLMPVFDSVSLMAASFAMGMMALEIPFDEDRYVDIEALHKSRRRNVHAR